MSLIPHPEMEPILAMMRAAPPLDYATMPIAEAREAWNQFQKSRQGPLRDCTVRDLSVGGIPCRLLNEAAGPGLIVFVHGGGWTFGSPSSHEEFARALALTAGAPVLLPDYRLAPEHRCPAAIEDVLAVLAALPPQKLVLGGDSSGANVALAVAQSGVRIDLLSLWYGCFAPIFDTDSHRTCGDGSFGLSTERMRWFWNNCCG